LVEQVRQVGQVGQNDSAGYVEDVSQGSSAADARAHDGVSVRRVRPDDGDAFARTAAEGWREFGYAEFMYDMARVYAECEGVELFLAEIDGRPVAAAAMNIHEGVAHLAGASTIPGARRRGAQNALLAHRLSFAAVRGCDIALMGALPGSGSQRNAERNGFRIAYTRVKFQKR
jgi:ribosomal protein S18 acetylase RimI-like enzyme